MPRVPRRRARCTSRTSSNCMQGRTPTGMGASPTLSPLCSVRSHRRNSWRARTSVTAYVERWREYREQLGPVKKKPIMFVMMNTTADAEDVGEYLRTKYPQDFGGDKLLIIHTNKQGEVSKKDLDKARAVARQVDEGES